MKILHKHREPAALLTAGGFSVTVLFALLHSIWGLWYRSPWHGSIGVYYLLLSLLRGSLLAAVRKEDKEEPAAGKRRFRRAAAFLLTLNAALAAPIALMVLDRRAVRMELVPAIASAAYTTYKLSAAALRFRKAPGSLFQRGLQVVQLVDGLVSLLVLQNTLIVAMDGGISQKMFVLAALSSAAVYLAVCLVSVRWVRRGAKEGRS